MNELYSEKEKKFVIFLEKEIKENHKNAVSMYDSFYAGKEEEAYIILKKFKQIFKGE